MNPPSADADPSAAGRVASPGPAAHDPRPAEAADALSAATAREDEWLWGWDPTPGIVSVWAEPDGRAIVGRRIAETGALVREDERYRPWILLDRLDDLRHLGAARPRRDSSIGICPRLPSASFPQLPSQRTL